MGKRGPPPTEALAEATTNVMRLAALIALSSRLKMSRKYCASSLADTFPALVGSGHEYIASRVDVLNRRTHEVKLGCSCVAWLDVKKLDIGGAHPQAY